MKIFEVEEGQRIDFSTQFREDFDTAWEDIIINECSDAVNFMIANKKVLYRGANHSFPDAFKSRSRSNRKPRDSHPLAQKIFDQYLDSQKIAAKRSNSIFVTSNFKMAEDYGKLYYIFPIDGAEYSVSSATDLQLYNSKVLKEDLVIKIYDAIDNYNVNYGTNVREVYLFPLYDPSQYFTYEKVEQNLSDIRKAFPLDPLLSTITIEKLINYDYLNELAPTNDRDSINEAMKRGKEILVHGSYYSLSVAEFSFDTNRMFKNRILLAHAQNSA